MDSPNHKSATRSLFEDSESITYPKNQIILHALQTIEHLYHIEQGYVKVYTINTRGEEQLHVIYGPGDVFALTILVGDAESNIFVQAMTECHLLRLRLSEAERKLKGDALLAFSMLQRAIEQYKVYVMRVYSLEYRYARERLAHRLLTLASRFGQRTEEGIVILAPLTQQVLASSINLSRETVSREMERFLAKGYLKEISRSGALLVITNPEALAKEVPGSPLYPIRT